VSAQFSIPDFEEDSLQSDFIGTFANTIYDTSSSGLSLDASSVSGTYTSEVINLGDIVDFQSVEFRPDGLYGSAAELADNQGSNGGLSMAGNTSLFHIREAPGATVINDTSGNGNTDFCGGVCPPVTTNGYIGNALDFQNQNGIYLLPGNQNVQNLSQFTFAAWINPDNLSNSRTLYSEPVSGSNNRERVRIEIRNRRLRVRIRTFDGRGAPNLNIQTPPNAIEDNEWQHVAFVFNADTDVHTIYINGVPQTFNVNVPPFPNTAPPPQSTRIGMRTNGNARFDGRMDEIATFNRALSDVEVANMASRGGGDITLQLRTCDDPLCSGEAFVGPGGTGGSADVYNINGIPTTHILPDSIFPNNLYIQYAFTIQRPDLAIDSPIMESIRINYNRQETRTISFAVRNESATANTNICDLGEASISQVSSCRYRLWVNTNAANGYTIFVRTDGNLDTPDHAIANAATGPGGGDDISNATAGIERYGIVVNPGSATGGSMFVGNPYFAGTNAVAINNLSNQDIVLSNGPNTASETDTTFTALIEHRLNIAGDTPPGNYTQRVTYSAVPNF
jgi:hypothetical protein